MAIRRRRLVLFYGLALAAILLFALFPLISALGSGAIAEVAGCRLDESWTYPCPIGGTDFGATLYFFGVLGWAGLITIPVGAVACCIWLTVLIVHVALRVFSSKE